MDVEHTCRKTQETTPVHRVHKFLEEFRRRNRFSLCDIRWSNLVVNLYLPLDIATKIFEKYANNA